DRPGIAARSVADRPPIGECDDQVASYVTTEALPDRVRQRVRDVPLDLAQRIHAPPGAAVWVPHRTLGDRLHLDHRDLGSVNVERPAVYPPKEGERRHQEERYTHRPD